MFGSKTKTTNECPHSIIASLKEELKDYKDTLDDKCKEITALKEEAEQLAISKARGDRIKEEDDLRSLKMLKEDHAKELRDTREKAHKELQVTQDTSTRELTNLKEDHARELANLKADYELKLAIINTDGESAIKEANLDLTIENAKLKEKVDIIEKAFKNLGFDVKDMKEILGKLVDGVVAKNTINLVK